HLGDHAAHGGRVFQRRAPVHLVQAQADERLALHGRAADGAADLFDNQRLVLLLRHRRVSYSSAVTAAPRRACSAEYLMPRCAAMSLGCIWLFSASNVARTMLYG